MDKVMIIAPHPDDEVYGCCSYLDTTDRELVIVYVTSLHPLFPDGENLTEQKKLAEAINFKPVFMNPHHGQTNVLDRLGQSGLIDEFEKGINEYQPDIVLVPCPSYNQDHRAVYDAALTAMRPHDRNYFVKRILLYEEPETFGTLRKPDAFRPNYYRPLDIDKKIKIMNIYQTQMRGHRTPNHVKAIATVRGMQSGMEYAEAFEVARWIE